MATLDQRLSALEVRTRSRPLAHLTDEELEAYSRRLTLAATGGRRESMTEAEGWEMLRAYRAGNLEEWRAQWLANVEAETPGGAR